MDKKTYKQIFNILIAILITFIISIIIGLGIGLGFKKTSEPFSQTPPTINKDTLVKYTELISWIYSDLGGNNLTNIPERFTRLDGDERWALFQDNLTPGHCTLLHRATYDTNEILTDLYSQFTVSQNKNGIYVNPEFWKSYTQEIQLQQNNALQKYISNGTCTSLDLVGHSLGGATVAMAAVDNGSKLLKGKINNIITFGNPRPFSTTQDPWWWLWWGKDRSQTCNNFNNLARGNVLRFAHIKSSNHDDGDPVPALPLSWDHCAKQSVLLYSEDPQGQQNVSIDTNAGLDIPNDRVYTSIDDFASWLTTFVTDQPSWHNITGYRSIIEKTF